MERGSGAPGATASSQAPGHSEQECSKCAGHMGARAFVLLTPTQGRDGRQWVSDPAFSLAERTRPPRRRRSHWAERGKRPPLPQPSLDAADQEVFVTGWWEGQGLGLSKQERGEKNL